MSKAMIDHLLNLPAKDRRELVLAELKLKSRVRIILNGLHVSEMREMVKRMSDVADELEALYSEYSAQGSSNGKISATDIVASLNVKYFKDGKAWSGKGRRPEEFKGLSRVELEGYRVNIGKIEKEQ